MSVIPEHLKDYYSFDWKQPTLQNSSEYFQAEKASEDFYWGYWGLHWLFSRTYKENFVQILI